MGLIGFTGILEIMDIVRVIKAQPGIHPYYVSLKLILKRVGLRES